MLVLAELHLDALYARDKAERIVACRDPEVPPPLLHVVRTAGGSVWAFRAGIPEGLCDRIAAELARPAGDLVREPPGAAAVRGLLAEHAPVREEYCGPAFAFPADLPPPGADCVRIPRTGDERAVGPFAWVAREADHDGAQPFIARIVGSQMASVCHSARLSERAAEAGVETADPYRGRGFAAEVTAAWAAALRAEGRVPLYSTSWTNHASHSVARKLGLRMYAADWHIR